MRNTILLAVATLLALAAPAGAKEASPELNAAAQECFGNVSTTWTKMIGACDKVIAADVTSDNKAGAYYNRGSAYMRSGSADKALADFNSALKLAPNFARALEARGRE